MDFLQLKVSRKEVVAKDAILIYLEEINHQPVHYEAGQFFTFIFHHYGREQRRSYSIATTPGVEKEIAVVIKKVVNGEISRYLIDQIKTGDILSALPPAGRFTIKANMLNLQTIYFIAAGSGITPVYSIIKKLLHEESASMLILIYQNHNEASTIFKNELEVLQQKFTKRFKLVILLSRPVDRHVHPQRLNNNLLEQLIRLHYNRDTYQEFYLCGPGSFMRMAQFVLRFMGVANEDIRKEYFVIDPLPVLQTVMDVSPKYITLRWKGQVFKFSVTYPLNILQAALNNNIHLPYSCRGGRCSSCTVKCISGKVSMSINEVLTDKDLRQGLVLTCVGYAETDLELEL